MNLPNKITVFRFCCVPVLLACAFINFPYHWVAALLVYFIACMSDKADGIIARKQGIVTDFGKLMDPLSDKTLVFAAYIIFFNIGWHTDIVIMIMLAREFLVAGIRMAAASTGEVIAANKFGKAKTFLQMATTGMVFLLLAIGEGGPDIDTNTPWLNIYCTIAFWIVGIITALSGIIYAKDGWHLIKTK
ncbi:MAG: CDP-diacylglycerol--glycerol-3-phosphate 3-phosphatidyltransferase [Clostridiales bacterium]|nr:CDP-diacylglycerol--glycerol-3-phosphate 3-phosphatidyltransferase [Clostridiales bacterium]